MPVARTAPGARTTTETGAEGRRFNAILDAAEHIFANSGYDGATMRAIAARAGVTQALIHYHFKDKASLFTIMTERRAGEINTARLERLGTLLAGDARPPLAAVVDALFRPIIEQGLEMARKGGGFARIMVSLANSTQPRDQALARRLFDPVAEAFIAAFQRAEPGLSRPDAVWGYMFSIGVGMTMMAGTGRAFRLSGGLADDRNAEQLLDRITTFICAGIQALEQGGSTQCHQQGEKKG